MRAGFGNLRDSCRDRVQIDIRTRRQQCRNKLANYKAPAASSNECVLKTFCTSHDEGRRVYRSLAAFHLTDVGRFHRRLSRTVLAVALAFAVAGVVACWGTPGEWFQVVVAGTCNEQLLNRIPTLFRSCRGGRSGKRSSDENR
jgi:hypothetical protein